jgi:signal transduction histidine kinase
MGRVWAGALLAGLLVMETYHQLGLPLGPEPVPFVVVLFLATAKGYRILAIAAAVTAAAMVTIPDGDYSDLPQVLPALAVVIACGEITRIRRAYLLQSRQRAVDAERLRISRELHDVLVHHMSVINVQAGAALLRPGHATAALGVIKQASREALGEVRSALGVLRAPSVRQLDELLDRVRTDGLSVSKRVRGQVDLPPDVDHVAYRIVQEALTNVVRHSEATKVTVRLDCGPQAMTVLVQDNGRGGDSLPGNGLRGMAERVEALGGEFDIQGADGFRVLARLPVVRSAP